MIICADSFSSFRKHWIAMILAIFIGFVCVAPQIYFSHHTSEYAGIEMMGTDAEEHYSARINQAYQGYYAIGNTFLPNKNIPFVLPGLGENIVALIAHILEIRPAEAVVFSKFIFPLIAALVLYALVFIVSRSKATALVSTSLVFCGTGLLSGPAAWLALLRGSPMPNGFLEYARPINPEISGILLFCGLICFYKAFIEATSSKRPWIFIILSGIFVALAAYVSIYICSFLVMIHVLIFLWSVYKREFQNAVNVLATGLVAALIGIPYFLNFAAAHSNPYYAEVLMRGGVATSHAPIIGLWIPLILILVIFLFPQRFQASKKLFIFSSVALLMLLNQQLVTGHIVQPGHYHWYITIPLSGIVLSIFVVAVIEALFNSLLIRYGMTTLMLLVFLFNGIGVQKNSYHQALADTITSQRYSPILNYMNTVPGHEFIWSDSTLASFISMYTAHNAAASRQAPNYLISKKYLEDVVLLNYRLRGILPEHITATMTEERGDISSMIYALYWRNQAGSFEAIPDEDIAALSHRYTAEYTIPLKKLLTDLGITYFIWDRTAHPEWKLPTSIQSKNEFSSGDFEVYNLK